MILLGKQTPYPPTAPVSWCRRSPNTSDHRVPTHNWDGKEKQGQIISKTPEKCISHCDGAKLCIANSGDGRMDRCSTLAGHGSPEGEVPQRGARDAASARKTAWAELGLSQGRTINLFYSLQSLKVRWSFRNIPWSVGKLSKLPQP